MTNKKMYLSPSIIYRKLSKVVIGQDKVKRAVSNAVFMHYLKAYRLVALDKPYGPKSNILIVGPTGAGKTHIMKTLETVTRDIPILHLDATAMTNYGFQGNSLEDLILDWKFKGVGDMADYGIIFIDEIDKLCSPLQSSKSEDWNKTLQQGILKIVEGCVIRDKGKEIDTSNILFVFGGNFSELRKRISENAAKKAIGFKSEDKSKMNMERIHGELVEAGLIQELAGRISTIVEVTKLSKKELKEIFKNEEGPYYNYVDLFKVIDEDLELSEYYIDKIVDICIKTDTGARGLQTALDEILENRIFNLPDVDFSPEPPKEED